MRMNRWVVERLAPEDWAEFRELRLRALTADPDAFGSTLDQEQALTEVDWRGRLGRRAQFVVRDGGRTIGTAGGIVIDGDAELVSMWVEPEARGSGVAGRLIDAVVAWAGSAGHAQIDLWVSVDNTRAQQCYLRQGFVPVGETQPVRDDDPDRLEMRMRNRI